MQKIGIKDVSTVKNADYNDGDIIILSHVGEVKDLSNVFMVEMAVTVVCYKGQMSLSVGGRLYNISANQVLVLAPNVVIESYIASKDLEIKLLCFSLQTLKNNIVFSNNLLKCALYVRQHPVVEVKTDFAKHAFYFDKLVNDFIKYNFKRYQKEVMSCLLQVVIYFYLSLIEERMERGTTTEDVLTQSDVLTAKFLSLLEEEYGRIRSVKQIADKMNISAKYLCSVVKKSSGQSPQHWVHQYTTNEIIRQLKYTDKTIKEIVFEMDFPDSSFFGKFFKNQTGMSPKEYRKTVVGKMQ